MPIASGLDLEVGNLGSCLGASTRFTLHNWGGPTYFMKYCTKRTFLVLLNTFKVDKNNMFKNLFKLNLKYTTFFCRKKLKITQKLFLLPMWPDHVTVACLLTSNNMAGFTFGNFITFTYSLPSI